MYKKRVDQNRKLYIPKNKRFKCLFLCFLCPRLFCVPFLYFHIFFSSSINIGIHNKNTTNFLSFVTRSVQNRSQLLLKPIQIFHVSWLLLLQQLQTLESTQDFTRKMYICCTTQYNKIRNNRLLSRRVVLLLSCVCVRVSFL